MGPLVMDSTNLSGHTHKDEYGSRRPAWQYHCRLSDMWGRECIFETCRSFCFLYEIYSTCLVWILPYCFGVFTITFCFLGFFFFIHGLLNFRGRLRYMHHVLSNVHMHRTEERNWLEVFITLLTSRLYLRKLKLWLGGILLAGPISENTVYSW